MKIGIITHYEVHNHGALLQLNALEKVLEKKGYTAKALRYKKNYDFLEEGIDKKYNISIRSVFWYLGYLKENGIKRTLFNVRKKKILQKFRNTLIGEFYSKAENLDAVFVGSDEVFSVECGINAFFFGFGLPCDNIYAYAACSGPTKIEDTEKYNLSYLISAGLEQFKNISVRDENTREIVKVLTDIDTQVVCDPVILYGYQTEQKRLIRKIKKDYLLVYAYDNNMNDEAEVKAIKEYAKQNNLLIVSAGFYHKWCDMCVDASPVDLLGYFKYAKYVVTDTFHGSVMSMITNAEFVAKIRGNGNKLNDLLNRFGISERIVNHFESIESVFKNKIDYAKVNELISVYRDSSLSYIDMCLEECNNE